MTKIVMWGFLGGLGFMASQELWWVVIGLAGFCHG